MAAGKHQSHAKEVDVQKIIIIVAIVVSVAALAVLAGVFIFGGDSGGEKTPPPTDTGSGTTPPTDPPDTSTQPPETAGPSTEPQEVRVTVTGPDGAAVSSLTLTVGDSVELTAAVTPEGGETPAWTAEGTVTLNVDETGLKATLTAASEGSGTVTVTAGDASAQIAVTVEGPAAPQYTNPLTGLACDADLTEYRPYAVMLNNIRKSTPQRGILQADMIFEIPVEGNITRLMGLYQSFKDAETIGSIRSARPYFIDIARGFDAIFIHAGGSPDAYALLKSSGITNIDGTNGTSATFHQDEVRKQTMGYEHSLMLDVPTVEPYLTKRGDSLKHNDGFSAGFTFAEVENRPGSPAADVEVKFNSSKSTFFEYDSESKQYLVSQFDKPMTDEATGEQLKVRNVVTIITRISRITGDTEGRLRAVLTGSGDGWFMCDGVIQRITWSRTAEGSQFKFTDEDGKDLVLAPGVTYIAILPTSSGSVQVR